MSQKNVFNIVQCNAVSFSKDVHKTGVQRCRKTSQTVRIPFRLVSFRTVPRSPARSRNAALFIEERLPRWSACHFPATYFTLLTTKKSLAKPFLKKTEWNGTTKPNGKTAGNEPNGKYCFMKRNCTILETFLTPNVCHLCLVSCFLWHPS